ncbi:hypothetical protein GEMRC1_002540 [Eukaryota sp. GEM-RC1]
MDNSLHSIILSITGHFDIGTVRKVDLSGSELGSIECSQPIPNATLFCCSHNYLTSLSGIEQWTSLIVLDVSNNSLSDLLPLKNHPTLSELNIVNNQIRSIDALFILKSLPALKRLSIALKNSQLNPICQSDYRRRVVSLLPQLEVLDGIPCSSAGADVFLDNPVSLMKNSLIQLPSNLSLEPWIADSDKSINFDTLDNTRLKKCQDLVVDLRSLVLEANSVQN